MNLKGIDVSKHNGTIDWAKVRGSGVQFVMVRASYGKSGRDSQFEINAACACCQGLDVGAYHYSYAETVAQAKAEAQNFLEAVAGKKLTYPLVFDLESNSNTDKAADSWSDMAVAFMREVEAAGYFAMLYSNKSSLETRFDAKKIAPFAVWVAQWSSKNTYAGPYGIWQYSDSGTVPGIKGAVDLDLSYIDYASIIRNKKLNNLE